MKQPYYIHTLQCSMRECLQKTTDKCLNTIFFLLYCGAKPQNFGLVLCKQKGSRIKLNERWQKGHFIFQFLLQENSTESQNRTECCNTLKFKHTYHLEIICKANIDTLQSLQYFECYLLYHFLNKSNSWQQQQLNSYVYVCLHLV